MSKWIEPVFDRTQADVGYAIAQLTTWIKEGTPDAVVDLKGCFTVSDMNRIEGDIAYLSEKLSELGYYVDTSCKTWGLADLPTVRDVSRILTNIENIESAFVIPADAPVLPQSMVKYGEINDIEENLYQIKQLLENMVSFFKKSNTFKSGGKMFLPLRR
jgi:hypothetical protein